MQVKDLSFTAPEDNILYDELLLQLAERQQAGEVLRFWQSEQVFVVLGRIGNEHDDVWLERTRQDGIPVLRRTSGGGTVVQGEGCLNYTLVLDKNRHADLQDLRRSYLWISQQVITALDQCGIKATFKPISDIALAENEKKISGNAQHRGKHFILHHGTILCDFDLDLISRYLQMPKDIPLYRQGRPHHDFVANTGISSVSIKNALAAVFGLSLKDAAQVIDEKELLALNELRQKRPVRIS